MDYLSVCRGLRKNFPKPQKLDDIASYLGKVTTSFNDNELRDAIKSLTFFWKKQGWYLSEQYAVLLEEDEEAMLHSKGITIIKTPDSLPADQVLVKLCPIGQNTEKVIWF